jgi:hypothetical protein
VRWIIGGIARGDSWGRKGRESEISSTKNRRSFESEDGEEADSNGGGGGEMVRMTNVYGDVTGYDSDDRGFVRGLR